MCDECRNPNQNADFILREVMVAKANFNWSKTLLLAILAGSYIGFGCEISSLAAHDGVGFSGFGATRILAGAVFSLGLMLVNIAGAELFTGNVLIFGSILDAKVSKIRWVKNLILVYFSNLIGAILLAFMVFYANTWQQNDMQFGVYALKIGVAKVNLPFIEALIKGILCNWLVCLAVWMSLASKALIGKIFAIFFPIMAFVALGYEHSIANMFYIPKAILLSNKPELMVLAHISADKLAHLNMMGLINNLIPVTIGNIIGAAVFVAFFYWAAYLKSNKKCERQAF